MKNNLIQEITNCTHFCNLSKKESNENCCSKIVDFQKNKKIEIQLPEPFSGDLHNAPILFISSNPSISREEIYPTESWPKKIINDFFVNRFENRGEEASWVFNNKCLNKNGRSIKSVKYWSSINKRAEEILERRAIAGKDYCITEVVHCKSWNEIGVESAKEQCRTLFLENLISNSNAKVIIAIGVVAEKMLNSEKVLFGKPIYYLPHPNAFKAKTFEKVFNLEELNILKSLVKDPEIKEINLSIYDLPTEEEVRSFIKNELQKEKLKHKKKNILYLHGLDSKLSPEKREILEIFGDITAPDIDYYNNKNTIDLIFNEFKDKKIDVIIGSSMGGFIGFYLSKLLNKSCLVFNPALPYRKVDQIVPVIESDLNNFIQIVIGNKDVIVNSKENINYILNNISSDNNISIQIINQLKHQIPIDIFKNEIDGFFLKYNNQNYV